MRAHVNAVNEFERIALLYRDDSGALRKDYIEPHYVSYHKRSELGEDGQKVLLKQKEAGHLLSIKAEGEWLRVEWINRYRRDEECSSKGPYAYRDIHTYEADVSPVRRHFADHGFVLQRPRRVFLDIETDSRVPFARATEGLARVLSWALVCPQGKVLSGLLKEDSDEAEKDLLTKFWKVCGDYDQLVAWNGDYFDFPVLIKRSKALGVRVDTRRWLMLDHLKAYKRYNTGNAESGEEKQSFALNKIAKAVLGESKLDVDGSKTWEEWAAGGARRARLLEYNIQDTALLQKIEAKTGYLELFTTLCEVTNCFPESRSLQPTVQVDGLLLRLGMEHGVHFKTKWFASDAKPEKFAGAFVMQPTLVGIGEQVFVGDFTSLYPSIMITFNISPETKRSVAGFGTHAKAATGTCFDVSKPGILPIALKSMLELRGVWKKKYKDAAPGSEEAKDAERRSTAYKIAANSFYGVMGSPYSRYFDKELVESTTLSGVWLIKETIRAAQEQGLEVVYGDTDSLFVRGCDADGFARFVHACNVQLYPKLTQAAGCVDSRITLNNDKRFKRLVFVSAKRYVGIFESGAVEVKGLEIKRGDVIKLARVLQSEVVGLLARGTNDAAAFVELLTSHRSRILSSPLPLDDIQLTKSISRPLDEYKTNVKKDGEDSAGAAHVRVAKILRERGEEVREGTRIAYIVTDATQQPMTVIPVSDFDGEFDRYYLWEELVYPPTMRLLAASFPSENWEQYLKARPRKPRKRKVDPQESLFP